MSKVKNQHFVPQFYLRNFARNKSKIFVYDKVLKKSFLSNIDSIACDKYFYDHTGLNEYFGCQVIESSFSEFENLVAPVLDLLIKRVESKRFNGFEKVEKETLAEFLYYQMIRTRENRIIQGQFHELMWNELLERGFTKEHLIESGFSEQFNAKDEHLKKILRVKDIEETLSDFYNRIWILVYNNTKYGFYTSDDPVSKYTHDSRGLLGYELFLPITPRYGIMVLIRKSFKDFESFENKLMPFMDKEWIKWYNHLQIIQSTRQVYSIDSNFSFVEKLVNENPLISDLNRPRVTSMFKR